jgi:hypothetical protein
MVDTLSMKEEGIDALLCAIFILQTNWVEKQV